MDEARTLSWALSFTPQPTPPSMYDGTNGSADIGGVIKRGGGDGPWQPNLQLTARDGPGAVVYENRKGGAFYMCFVLHTMQGALMGKQILLPWAEAAFPVHSGW